MLALADVTAFQLGLLVLWGGIASFVWWLARIARRLRPKAP